MSFSRRKFMQWTASVSSLAIATPDRGAELLPRFNDVVENRYRPDLMPPQKEVWDNLSWMAKLGPKYTGNQAHATYVEFLASHLQSLGLELSRDHYTLPRWEARRWEISVQPVLGASFKAPITSYFPYSGQTPPQGVTGELVYAGGVPAFDLAGNLEGKIVYVEFTVPPRAYSQWFKMWGVYPRDMDFPAWFNTGTSQEANITGFHKAGALGVIIGWTNVSDANAAYAYEPYGARLQGLPGLYVGRETGAKLHSLAGSGAKVTLTLEAETFPDTPTDTLIATLAGMSSDEVIIVNTHTDGPNANEENGGIGILALAKYFSQIPKSERKRTIAFILTTGHFAGAYVPSIQGVIKDHPDLIKKTVGALTIEHLGATEWVDDESFHYRPTGRFELALAQTKLKSTADVMLEALQGSGPGRTAVINPVHGPFHGEGQWLANAGVPTIGYIVHPNYLFAGTPNGCIDKLNPELMYSQLQVFAKVVHKMDTMTASELKGVEGGI